MRDSFGARLRRHREDRGVSLAEVAEQTKIKASLLEGLERDDISQWPAGIFRRAYVRAYAAAIGVDPEAAIREFLGLHPDPIETPEPAVPASSGLRGLFGTFRRRTSAPIASHAPTSHGVTSTVGKRPAEPLPLEPAVAEPVTQPSGVPVAVEAEPVAPAMPQQTVAPAESPEPVAPVSALAAVDKPVPSTDLLLAAAKVCTELGRVEEIGQVLPLLADAAKVLGARGLIVWVWDGIAGELEPALVHGYPAKVRARLRGVQADADNVTAAAYRAGAPLARSGALAVPLLMPSGCAGVLAIEVDDGREQDAEVRAFTTFFAAMLAQLVGAPASDAREADHEPAARLAAPPG
jgi:transcriptional regulator with XRE-family HTH domain